ncbi:hypothetical protein [Microbacterium sp.]|uniref:hypothetical protein n=1 Tax=Microbacterium sp. TaxID=51671 RepID=UPI002810A9DF|nr:hypothetical protein [Microbacterium sp.]
MTIPPVPAAPAATDESEAALASHPASWWRRNRWALLAIAVLAPVTAIAIGWHEWHGWYGYGARPYMPVVAEEKESLELADATWGPVRSAEIDDLSGLDVPGGTMVIAAAIPVDPEVEGVACATPELVQQSTGRTWRPVRSEIGLGYDADEPSTCLSTETTPYELVVAFVLPDDVEGPFWVDVAPSSTAGAFVRFRIDP